MGFLLSSLGQRKEAWAKEDIDLFLPSFLAQADLVFVRPQKLAIGSAYIKEGIKRVKDKWPLDM